MPANPAQNCVSSTDRALLPATATCTGPSKPVLALLWRQTRPTEVCQGASMGTTHRALKCYLLAGAKAKPSMKTSLSKDTSLMTRFQFPHQLRTSQKHSNQTRGRKEIQPGIWVLKTFVHSSSSQNSSAVLPEKKIVKTGSDPPIAKQNPKEKLSWERAAPGGVPCKTLPHITKTSTPSRTNREHWHDRQAGLIMDAPCVWPESFQSNGCVQTRCIPWLHSFPCSHRSITHQHHSYSKKENRFFPGFIYACLVLDQVILQLLICLPLSLPTLLNV